MDHMIERRLNRFARLGAKVFNKPQAIHEDKCELIMGALSERLGLSTITRLGGEQMVIRPGAWWDDEDDGPVAKTESFDTRGYDVEFGVAKIEIEGTLVQKNYALRPESGMTGYDGIQQNFVEAMQDDRVRAIWLDIDSPGGEVAGMFDLADLIYSARGRKPIWAILNESAFSAAYALASAADRITVPRTGGVGSIGIVWMHCDLSQRLANEGVKVTFVKRGTRKVDGAPEIPLSEEALARFQKEIDTVGEMFEATVGRNRGLSADKIRDMNANTFLGADGVSQGLADVVLSPDAAFRALLDELG